MDQITTLLINRRYEALLLSLLILLFGELLVPEAYENLISPLLVIQNIVVGLIVFYHEHKSLRWFIIITLVLISILEVWLTFFIDYEPVRIIMFFLFIIYFVTISYKVYAAIFKVVDVGVKMISAVFCGFIMLVTIGSFMFVIIELIHPHSFSNLGEDFYPNIQYFSFITTLTIGYGDIVPLTMVAKKASMLLGLTGNFYTVFVTGITIGKFLNNKKI